MYATAALAALSVGVATPVPVLARPLAVVPLPKERPLEAPPREAPADEKPDAKSDAKSADAPPVAAAPAPPPPSACRLALTDAIAIAPSIPPIVGPGACGGDDLVRLEAVILKDGKRVPLKPAATLRCKMAAAVTDWVREDLAPLAEGLSSTVAELDNFDSFDCRGRNRIAGARLSEHGKANALDVRGFRLSGGQMISLTERNVDRGLREKVLASVCARFSTVLGPGSDWYHEDHIHLDLAERRAGYRMCQWSVYDPLPQIAPLMPAERPAEAPPREEEVAKDGKKE